MNLSLSLCSLDFGMSNWQKINNTFGDEFIRRKWFSGQEIYTPFVILGWYRSGTTLLTSLLQNHPELVCYSEVFLPKEPLWGQGVYNRFVNVNKAQQLRDQHPDQFLKQYIFRAYQKGKGGVGFKLLYPQLQSNVALANALGAIPNLKVILLQRENLLDLWVSAQVARKTGVKNKVNTQRDSAVQLTLDPKDLEKRFQNLKRGQDEMHVFAKQFNSLELTYEALNADRKAVMQEVFQFLNVTPKEVETSLVKQQKQPLSEIVQNFDGLVAYFKGTDSEKYFL